MQDADSAYEAMGIRIFFGDVTAARRQLTALVGSGQGNTIMTVAAWTLIQARRDGPFLEALREAKMVLPDGWPVVVMAKMSGRASPARLAGVDMVPIAAQCCRDLGRRIVLFGSSTGVAQQAAKQLQAKTEGLDATGVTPPFRESFGEADIQEMASTLRALDPSIVVVGISVPKGEKLAHQLSKELPGVTLLCVGGALDNIAGTRKRAPALLRSLYLEWAWRAFQNPADKFGKGAEILVRWPFLAARLLAENKRHAAE